MAGTVTHGCYGPAVWLVRYHGWYSQARLVPLGTAARLVWPGTADTVRRHGWYGQARLVRLGTAARLARSGPSQVNTLPKAKSLTRSKQNKGMNTCSSVYSERGVPLPILTSGGE